MAHLWKFKLKTMVHWLEEHFSLQIPRGSVTRLVPICVLLALFGFTLFYVRDVELIIFRSILYTYSENSKVFTNFLTSLYP